MAVAGAIGIFVVAPAMICFAVAKLVETMHPRMNVTGSSPSLSPVLAQSHAREAQIVVVDADEIDQDMLPVIAAGSWKAIVLTSARGNSLEEAVRAGVSGVVRKTDPPDSLLRAIERVHQGELWIDRSLAARLLAAAREERRSREDPVHSRLSSLTRRERQVVAALLHDQTACGKVIAPKLHISERTLRNHLSSIYRKLKVQNRLSLHALVARHQVGGPDSLAALQRH